MPAAGALIDHLEREAQAELQRSRLTVAAVQRGEDEKVREALIGRRIAEIRGVEQVVQLEARLEGLTRGTEAITELQVGLLERLARGDIAVPPNRPALRFKDHRECLRFLAILARVANEDVAHRQRARPDICDCASPGRFGGRRTQKLAG